MATRAIDQQAMVRTRRSYARSPPIRGVIAQQRSVAAGSIRYGARTGRRSSADRRLCVSAPPPAAVLFCAPRRAGDGGPVCLVDLAVRWPELPSGTVTFLFTDLEGSTRLWEEHPDAMQLRSPATTRSLRDAIEAHAGQVVKTTGDGFHAAFVTAHDAVGAASGPSVHLTPSRGRAPVAVAGAHGSAHR